MIFVLKHGIVNCNEWEIKEMACNCKEIDSIYFHFQDGYIKNIDLERGSKEKIFDVLSQKVIDLRKYQI